MLSQTFQRHFLIYDMELRALKDLMDALPHQVGVYLMKDQQDRILYVGKAKDLKKRVLSYLKAERPKVSSLLERVEKLDFLLTANEKEALILESNLIKKHLPRYNVVLRDDKQYPSLRVSLDETFPRLQMVRRIKKDKAFYFGPFSSARKMKETTTYLQKIFPLRLCRQKEIPQRSRPCLYYQTGKCPAPCHGKIQPEEYHQRVKEVIWFFEGRNQELLKNLKRQMKEASAEWAFEKAALLRDRIRAISETLKEQKIVSPRFIDVDVIALFQEGESIRAGILFVRLGSVTGLSRFRFKNLNLSPSEVLTGLIQQYYRGGKYIPPRILTPSPIEDRSLLEEVLSDLKGQKVTLMVPVRGEGRRWMAMAEENIRLVQENKEPSQDYVEKVAKPLQSRLGLKRLPYSVGALDISNIQGESAVGSWVVFKQGQPDKSGYRRFRIRSGDQPNDYAMMEEVIARLFRKEAPWPDLVLIDGGKGQLNILTTFIGRLPEDQRPDALALAKKTFLPQGGKDGIYLPNRKNPLRLSSDSPLLHYLEKVRDEAHRFALSYHHKLREKRLRPEKQKASPRAD